MKSTLNVNGRLVNLKEPLIMGILNTTPDSFYKDSRFSQYDNRFIEKAHEMINNNVDILDIGGYSTRPGAEEISIEDELARVIPAIELLRSINKDIIISIDTFRSKVAQKALEAGANIVNDISAGTYDNNIIDVVKDWGVPYVMMHSRNAQNMLHSKTNYDNLILDILIETFNKANKLRKSGIKDIIIDPGFGFSKKIDENYQLLKNLDLFKNENFPLLIGISRKSMIYKLLNTSPEESLYATGQLNFIGLIKSAKIIRVHDVNEAIETRILYKKMFNN